MGKTNTKKNKMGKIAEFHNMLKTLGFSDLFHDIHDPVIHGTKGIMEIRFALENKWNDPNKASNFCSFNPSVNATANKIAPWVAGSAHMALPQVFPCPEIVMLCAENYDENRKAIVNKITQEEILSITESEFASLLNLGFQQQQSNVHIDLGKLADDYEKLDEKQRDSYIRGITSGCTLSPNHMPPYDFEFFVPWAQDSISLLAFCLGLDSNKQVDASILEMLYHIHFKKEPVRYRFIEHIVRCMQDQLLMIQRGSEKTFRFTTYLCYLLLAKHRALFEANKLCSQTQGQNPIYEWTPQIRMIDNRRNYNNFVDFFLAPMYHKITGTPMPRLPVTCRNCIQLGSELQLADWYLMEEYTVLRFYGSWVEPYKLPIHVTERVFALEYVRQMESTDVLFHGQQKKMIFPSLPFSFGGFAFERRGFKVAEAFFSIFRFDVDSHWQYDPLNIIGARLKGIGTSARKYQHESMPLIEKFKNMDSWEEVKKQMEKYAAENNMSIQELSSQIMALHKQKGKVQGMTSSNFYKKADKPSTKPIPKELMNECIDAGWSRSKISQFWEMRKNLGEPKTSADLDEVEEDTMFDELWNKEHPAEAHHSDTDDDYDDQDSLNPSSSTQI